MCGIAGVVNVTSSEPVSHDLLARMAKTMSHRGPDGEGTWVSDSRRVGFSHRRLSIVDLSEAGRQPMATGDKKIWVTFNGEIYNFVELRRNLEARGHRLRTQSDTEVIPYLYRQYGAEFYERLDGDFALALWDEEEGLLVLARDRAGVKPLYYTRAAGRFIFASEIRALLVHPAVSADIDETALYHYMTYLVAPPPSTLIRGIYKLEAASALIFRPENWRPPRLHKYWEPIPRVDHARSFSELNDELAELFRRSVRKRQQSDVPVGVLFSGGVDSTLNLTEFQSLVDPDPVATFTVGLDDAGLFHDDSAIAREMAERLGTIHHELRVSDACLLQAVDELAKVQDEPVSDPVAVPLFFVTKLAKSNGYTVLHAGEGADELFAGYEKYRTMIDLERRVWSLLSILPRRWSRWTAQLLGLSSSPVARKSASIFERRARGQELFVSSAVACYENEKRGFLAADPRKRLEHLDSYSCVAPYYNRIDELCPDATFLQKITYVELQCRLPELLLMRADKMSMANSVEIRVPFLDRDLMDFAMRVPDEYKIQRGILKAPIKGLAARRVERSDVYRPKTGFGVPIQQWFRGDLGDALRAELEQGSAVGLFDTQTVLCHLERGMRTVNDAFQVWMIYNFLVWHRMLRS